MQECVFIRVTECTVKCEVCDKELKYAQEKDPRRLRRACRTRGLGDTVARLASVTGVSTLVRRVVGACGCEKRKEALNALFPYKSGER